MKPPNPLRRQLHQTQGLQLLTVSNTLPSAINVTTEDLLRACYNHSTIGNEIDTQNHFF
jgi:hypothetical protein